MQTSFYNAISVIVGGLFLFSKGDENGAMGEAKNRSNMCNRFIMFRF
jgi:hypothetical protein